MADMEKKYDFDELNLDDLAELDKIWIAALHIKIDYM